MTPITGTKMIAGTAGWIREKKSRKRLSNRGGDALSCFVRSCAMARILASGCATPEAGGAPLRKLAERAAIRDRRRNHVRRRSSALRRSGLAAGEPRGKMARGEHVEPEAKQAGTAL